MGNAQSNNNNNKKKSFEQIIDYVASNYILTQNFKDMENLSNMDYCKAWQKSVESELICYYSLMFGRSPEFNLAHKSTASKKRINPNSISQKVVNEFKEQSLMKFL